MAIKQYTKFTDKIYEEIDEYIEKCKQEEKLPSLFWFAEEYGYPYESITDWRAKTHERYKGDTYVKATNKIRNLRKEMMIEGGLSNNYNANFAKYRIGFEYQEWDTQKVEQDSKNININTELNDEQKEAASRLAEELLSSEGTSE